jgi:hypothetical protein
MALSSKQLLDVLTYDSEEYKILTLEQRCTIHKEIARQAHNYAPNDFADDYLQDLLITICVDIQTNQWKRPVVTYYLSDTGTICKTTQYPTIS